VFRCCESCDLVARETAEVGYNLGVIEAHERLADMPLRGTNPALVAAVAASWARWVRRYSYPPLKTPAGRPAGRLRLAGRVARPRPGVGANVGDLHHGACVRHIGGAGRHR
jgi:hypothetical protein